MVISVIFGNEDEGTQVFSIYFEAKFCLIFIPNPKPEF